MNGTLPGSGMVLWDSGSPLLGFVPPDSLISLHWISFDNWLRYVHIQLSKLQGIESSSSLLLGWNMRAAVLLDIAAIALRPLAGRA